MFRILGFIAGALAAMVTLVILVGMPSFHLDGESADASRFNAAIQQLRDRQQDASPPETVSAPPPEIAADEAQVAIATTTPPAGDDAIVAAAPVPPALDTDTPPVAQQQPGDFEAYSVVSPSPAEAVPALTEANWESFWNPFRSEIAAEGFVRRLENVTGLDYRVLKVKNGVYEVAFSYIDDAERSSKLSQISAATGLDLSGAGL